MARLQLSHIQKTYDKTPVVHDMSLEIADKEFVVLVGPSGCGKSTTLRMIAGLESISGGALTIGERVVNEMPPRERNIAMVFQDYALYPHMSVAKNLGFSLKISGVPKEEIEKRVQEAANVLGLTEYLNRKPGQLSGGQRQRVAMGRAIVRHPDVYLFDEPLSNLDAKLRTQMRLEIKKLHQRVGNTIVYVTHDQTEAMTLADRIVVMRDGYIEQVGTPRDVFDYPANTFVATFIGSPPMNLLDAQVCSTAGGQQLQLAPDVFMPVPQGYMGMVQDGQQVRVGIRPQDISPVGSALPHGGDSAEVNLPVLLNEDHGAETMIYTELAGNPINAIKYSPGGLPTNEVVPFTIALEKIHLFEAVSQTRIVRNAHSVVNEPLVHS